MLPSLDGRRFRSSAHVPSGDVGPATVFDYRQDGDVVHASYSGGDIRLGFLVGTRTGDRLDFRYVQLRVDGTTAAGHCLSEIELSDDDRLRLRETWAWETQPGSGTSMVEEVKPSASG
jgi:hypothetical protein